MPNHRILEIEFPSLIVFDDFSMKLVHSPDEINWDFEWSGVNYCENDFIIDNNLAVGRFAGLNQIDEGISVLLHCNVICRSCSKEEYLNIAKILKENIDNCNINDEELSFATDIIQIISDRN